MLAYIEASPKRKNEDAYVVNVIPRYAIKIVISIEYANRCNTLPIGFDLSAILIIMNVSPMTRKRPSKTRNAVID